MTYQVKVSTTLKLTRKQRGALSLAGRDFGGVSTFCKEAVLAYLVSRGYLTFEQAMED